MEPLKRLNEIAEYLAISRSSVYRLIEEGMPVVRPGADPRFRPSEVDAWLDERRKAKV